MISPPSLSWPCMGGDITPCPQIYGEGGWFPPRGGISPPCAYMALGNRCSQDIFLCHFYNTCFQNLPSRMSSLLTSIYKYKYKSVWTNIFSCEDRSHWASDKVLYPPALPLFLTHLTSFVRLQPINKSSFQKIRPERKSLAEGNELKELPHHTNADDEYPVDLK